MESKNGNKFLWGIHGLGVLLWVVCFFFGLAYHSSVIIGIPFSLVLGGLMFLFVRGMYIQKTKKTHEPKDNVFDLLYKILYGVLTLSSGIFLLHFVFMTTFQRDEIVRYAQGQYNELAQIFNENDPNSYVNSYVDYRLLEYEKSLETNNNPPGWIENKINSNRDDFMDSYETIKAVFKQSLFNQKKDKLNDIIWLDDIQSLLNDLYETKQRCVNELMESSQKYDYENRQYTPVSNNYTANLREWLKIDFNEINSNSILYSALLAIVFQFLILLVYFLSKRGDDRFKGKKTVGMASIE